MSESLRAALQETARVLALAYDRSIRLGDALIDAGGVDINRGQFTRLVENAQDQAVKALRERA